MKEVKQEFLDAFLEKKTILNFCFTANCSSFDQSWFKLYGAKSMPGLAACGVGSCSWSQLESYAGGPLTPYPLQVAIVLASVIPTVTH